MKQYDLTVELKEQGMTKIQFKKCKIVLSDKDNVEEIAQMIYGCWYDILSISYEECDEIIISKNYLIEQAWKLIRFE